MNTNLLDSALLEDNWKRLGRFFELLSPGPATWEGQLLDVMTEHIDPGVHKRTCQYCKPRSGSTSNFLISTLLPWNWSFKGFMLICFNHPKYIWYYNIKMGRGGGAGIQLPVGAWVQGGGQWRWSRASRAGEHRQDSLLGACSRTRLPFASGQVTILCYICIW